MEIIVISDTHGFVDKRWADLFAGADEIWHAGDIGKPQVMDSLAAIAPVVGVHGNIDDAALRRTWPEHRFIERNGLHIWITHIGGYPGRYAAGIRKGLAQHKPDIFVCGHSHLLRVHRDAQYNKAWIINPGAAGRHGFHKVRTAIRLRLGQGEITEMEVIEMGARGR